MGKGKSFGIIGVAGYIAPRHLEAIKALDGELAAALDPHDSVGILDRYFSDVKFFTEFERFDRHVEKLRRQGKNIDYFSICSPNYLHDAHVRFALRVGADAICEKPLVLTPRNLDALAEMEAETGRKIHPILQLRIHPSIVKLKQEYPKKAMHEIDLTYITPRGPWYHYSWKGDIKKSGGVATNIGVHFFDMLIWIFGAVKKNIVLLSETDRMAGYLELEHARIRWYLSLRREDAGIAGGVVGSPYRSIKIDGEEIEFSDGFTDLHTQLYKKIIDGEGFSLDDTRPAIQCVYDIRNAAVASEMAINQKHPLLSKI